MKTACIDSAADPDWLRLRLVLWPDATAAEHIDEMDSFIAEPRRYGQFVARSGDAQPAVGLAEVSIRSDHVNGTSTSPVAFLEGLYVSPAARRQGVARALLQAVAGWARANGCTELASDAALTNRRAHAVHRRLGFAETERVVCFNMPLD